MIAKMPATLRHWEITREKGKRKFILQNGVLAWGLPMFILMTFFVNRSVAPWFVAISAVIWAVAGAGFGWAVWVITEKKYQRFIAEHAPAPKM